MLIKNIYAIYVIYMLSKNTQINKCNTVHKQNQEQT
jgi:hypothetical protein